MTTDASTSSLINAGTSWGSALAAVFVSLIFYGISILQMFLYYRNYSNDCMIVKSLVAVVFLLNSLHTFIISAGVWEYFVVHFGDDKFFEHTHAPLLISIVVSSIVSSIVQSFFIYRICFLIRSRFRWLFPAILMPFVLAQLALGVSYTVIGMVYQTSVYAISGPLLTMVANAVNGLAAAVDIAITISLCTLLAMGRTGLGETDRMLLRLIFISVNTGLSSALFSLFSLILLAMYPNNLIFVSMYFPLCTIYCNTLLANLNVRAFVRACDRDPLGTHATLKWLKQQNIIVSVPATDMSYVSSDRPATEA